MFCWQETSGLEGETENQEGQDHLRAWTVSGQCLKARAESLWCLLLMSQHLSPPATASWAPAGSWTHLGDRWVRRPVPRCHRSKNVNLQHKLFREWYSYVPQGQRECWVPSQRRLCAPGMGITSLPPNLSASDFCPPFHSKSSS